MGREGFPRPGTLAGREQYLQILDRAASDSKSPWAKRISGILKISISGWTARSDPEDLVEINGAARRLLAAECSAFTKGLDLDSEPAIPYVDWARRLDGKDTIITFNYDTVVEMLAAKDKTCKISCIAPGDGLLQPGIACAHKLHGSVDWLDADWASEDPARVHRIQRSDDPFAALNCESPLQMVIGNPGPTKSQMTKLLGRVWDAAGTALREASAIVFVGYRFPPTDTYAQKFILDAIEANERNYLAVHVILGPNVGSTDIVRVRQLLALALAARAEVPFRGEPTIPRRSCNLRVWPLYAADFLGRAKKEQIAQPFMFRDFSS